MSKINKTISDFIKANFGEELIYICSSYLDAPSRSIALEQHQNLLPSEQSYEIALYKFTNTISQLYNYVLVKIDSEDLPTSSNFIETKEEALLKYNFIREYHSNITENIVQAMSVFDDVNIDLVIQEDLNELFFYNIEYKNITILKNQIIIDFMTIAATIDKFNTLENKLSFEVTNFHRIKEYNFYNNKNKIEIVYLDTSNVEHTITYIINKNVIIY